MSKVITDKLINDILEVVLEDMDCHHEVEHDQYRTETSVEYNLQNESKVQGKIIALLEPLLKGVPILWEHDRLQTLEKGEKLPEKGGLTVDEIISKYPAVVRTLLVRLVEQIKEEGE